jgi:DNA repair protein RecO
MNESVEALILSQSDYRDHDVMIRVMTAEYGILGFIAAGARKMTSRNAGSILPYTKAEIQFDYKEGRTLFRLKTARTRELWRSMHEDLTRSSAAAVAAELCLGMADESGASAKEEYEYLETAFRCLNEGTDPVTVLALYMSDLMKLFGIEPDVDECVRCGETTVHAVSVKDGGFLCAKHAQEAGVTVTDPGSLKRFRLLVKGGLAHIEMIEKAGGAKPADLEILAEMLKMHAGLTLRSFAFFKRFFAIE